jgi:hypothetical protein
LWRPSHKSLPASAAAFLCVHPSNNAYLDHDVAPLLAQVERAMKGAAR